MKSKTRVFVIVGLSAGVIALGLGTFIFVRNINQSKETAAVTTLTAGNSEHAAYWWSSSDTNCMINYVAARKNAAKVILGQTLYNHAIYLDPTGKPFIISGLTITYLTETDDKYSLRPLELNELRAECTGVKQVVVPDKTQYATLTSAEKIVSSDLIAKTEVNASTILIVNGIREYKLSVASGKDFRLSSDYFNVTEILDKCGVKYELTTKDGKKALKLTWSTWNQDKIAYISMDTASGKYIADKNVLANCAVTSGSDIYVSVETLNDVLGFTASYDVVKNVIDVITDTADIPQYILAETSQVSINAKNTASLTDALSSNALSQQGVLSSKSVSLYDSYCIAIIKSMTDSTTPAAKVTTSSTSSSDYQKPRDVGMTTVTPTTGGSNTGGSKTKTPTASSSTSSSTKKPATTSSAEVWPIPAAASASEYPTAESCAKAIVAIYSACSGDFAGATRAEITQAYSLYELMKADYSSSQLYTDGNAMYSDLTLAWDANSGRSTGGSYSHSGW